MPQLSIGDASMREGDAGADTLWFALAIEPPADVEVRVQFRTEDGTARAADADYVAVTGEASLAAGEFTGRLFVLVMGDSLLEGNEVLRVRLLGAAGAEIADSLAFGMISNDERTRFAYVPTGFENYPFGSLPLAWSDMNSDGWQDLPPASGGPGMGFQEIEGFGAFLEAGNYHGASWCDYDRNGFPDLVVLPYSVDYAPHSRALLLRNRGGGEFDEVALTLGIAEPGFGETAVWGDFDGDGWPDLFTPYYGHVPPFRSFLFRNLGNGTFEELGVQAGVDLFATPEHLKPEGATAADIDGDGSLDLYCASHLFLNDGTGKFKDVRAERGLPEAFDEGTCFVDVDSDGDLELYLRTAEGPRLFRLDDPKSPEITALAGLPSYPMAWGDSWSDVEGDGDLDLLVMDFDQGSHLLLNDGLGHFSEDLGFRQLGVSSDQSSWADVDRDGDPDFVVSVWDRRLYQNLAQQLPEPADGYLEVTVVDSSGFLTAHGATVRLTRLDGGPGAVQTRVVSGQNAYLSQNEYAVTFGGAGEGRYALAISYPSRGGVPQIVDSLINPELGPLRPGLLRSRRMKVLRDGRIEFAPAPVAGVTPGGAANLRLGPATPTPTRNEVEFAVDLERPGRAALMLLNVQGRRVGSLELGPLPKGTHRVRWSLREALGDAPPAGVYYCRLEIDGAPAGVRRVVLVH
ncbi:MAG: hypothetical protein HOP12_16055 [Candidatus Eisenbacteria bacterium]|uniref:Calx-beta domain-containing protein n=1 Tax=Eiseniibacteriota bacterium TaxID=2212470 RepID=A0A849SSK2_UNCEI|nr:hypothetical protein [Candidatus Eisenbacteria bacterium]